MIEGTYLKEGEVTVVCTNGMEEIKPELNALYYGKPRRIRKRQSVFHKVCIYASMGAPLAAGYVFEETLDIHLFIPLYVAALTWCAFVILANVRGERK